MSFEELLSTLEGYLSGTKRPIAVQLIYSDGFTRFITLPPVAPSRPQPSPKKTPATLAEEPLSMDEIMSRFEDNAADPGKDTSD